VLAIALMVAAGTFETTVNFYQTTRSNNSEDSRVHTHRRENLSLTGFFQFDGHLCEGIVSMPV
jgi:hypothetical protein